MTSPPQVWLQTFELNGLHYWKIIRYYREESREDVIVQSEQGYAEVLDAVDAGNVYCDSHNINARWNVPT